MKDPLGIEEVTFHKRTPLLDRPLQGPVHDETGAKLCVDDSAVKGFQDLGMEPTYEAIEAIDRAGVVIDCTPSGVGHAEQDRVLREVHVQHRRIHRPG